LQYQAIKQKICKNKKCGKYDKLYIYTQKYDKLYINTQKYDKLYIYTQKSM